MPEIGILEKNGLISPTSSRSVTETVNGSHKFVIQGYSLAKGMGIGKHIASENFTVGGYQWAIYFYPDGKNPEDNSTYVSVFIALASEGTDVRALFELTLVDQSGKGKHKVHSHFDRSLESGPYTLKYRGSMWGYKRFFRRAMLESSDFLKDDCLRINCTVGVVVSTIDCSRLHSVHVPDSDIGNHFGMLLENQEGSDVVFDVAGQKFHAHKLAMLHFIYRDSLMEDSELVASSSSSASSTSDTLAASLLAAADKYGLDRLRLMCESYLCKDISVNSVAKTLALADRHHAMELKSVCLKFAAENLGGILLILYSLAMLLFVNVRCKQSTSYYTADDVGSSRDLKEHKAHNVWTALNLNMVKARYAIKWIRKYLKENCPSLQSELLKTVAGCEEECSSGGGKSRRGAQLSDGGDTNGRRVRQRT
ncbi:hypothetical protein IFM89_038735 [Coptis chinensis]|uniref:MATH domain-containing protein n=1 Tax=Coptis chinensis TaxID=261450 RepID=A0A835LLN3_9MAGN|nr:hypothetical protein IFM89_038735 [Coptis chinensis]